MNRFTLIPFENIVKFGQKTMLDQPLFNVSWILGRFCNYKCSYCWPYANTDVPDHQNLEVYTNAIDEIKRQARENGFTDFHFSCLQFRVFCIYLQRLPRQLTDIYS